MSILGLHVDIDAVLVIKARGGWRDGLDIMQQGGKLGHTHDIVCTL